MHKTQYDEKRLALSEAGGVDDIYDLLAAHEHKVSTNDQVRGARIAGVPLLAHGACMRSHCPCLLQHLAHLRHACVE